MAPKRFRSRSTTEEDNEEEPEESVTSKDELTPRAKVAKTKVNSFSTAAESANRKERVEFTFDASQTAVSTVDASEFATRTLDVDAPLKAAPDSYVGTVLQGAGKQRFGPKRPTPGNVRISCRFDYQRDICKDWKETGSCGYGDACKFIHDRGDYKSGWELEAEWEAELKRKKEMGEQEEQQQQADQVEPTCTVCNQPFDEPVVTKCGHVFCEKCIKAKSKCEVCGEVTGGVFNSARKLLAKKRF